MVKLKSMDRKQIQNEQEDKVKTIPFSKGAVENVAKKRIMEKFQQNYFVL